MPTVKSATSKRGAGPAACRSATWSTGAIFDTWQFFAVEHLQLPQQEVTWVQAEGAAQSAWLAKGIEIKAAIIARMNAFQCMG